MIKFFRKIRHKLISEKRIAKYLLYAIGEIVLVMIGILLALQVNNWNEKRILKKNEVEILKQLNVDLKSNFIELNEIYTALNARISAGMKVMHHLNSSNEVTDSLKIWVVQTGGNSIFNNANTTYNNIETSGKNIISNDSLRLRITLMYELEFANVHERERRLYERTQDYREQLFKFFKASPSEDGNFVVNTPKDFIALKNNDDYKNRLVEILNHRTMRARWLKQTLENLEQLIKDVDAEIENQ